jgi:post-segregation antitoxin (ccd killing protein)
MAKTSIYLPDDLAEQVRKHGISISEVTQEALRRAVERAQMKENVMTGIDAVAERLRGTIDEEERQHREEGREDGIAWAREYATARELEDMASYDGSGGAFQDHSLVDFLSSKDGQNYVSIRVEIEDPYWGGFIDGAGEVWEAVRKRI